MASAALSASAAPPSAVRVSGDGVPECSGPHQVRGYEVEPSLAADSTGSMLVGAWQQDRVSEERYGSIANMIGISQDGGATWERQLVTGVATCGGPGLSTNASDPWVAVGPDGTIYVASLGNTPASDTEGAVSGIIVSSSRDGGASWSTRIVDGPAEDDKETLTADPAVPGRAWVVWRGTNGDALVSRTDDFGDSWGAPAQVSRSRYNHIIDVHLLPLGGDRLVALYSTGMFVRSTELVMQVSDDAGSTWSKPRSLHGWSRFGLGSSDGRYRIRADSEIFSAAAAPNGAGYAAIQADEGLMVIRTLDEGRHWSKRVVVDARGGAGIPTVAASPDGHSVALIYLSLKQDKKGVPGLPTRYRSAISRNRGKTWSDRPLTATFDPRKAKSGGAVFLGDYMGLAPLGSRGDFGALVIAARPLAENGPTDVFFARPH
jgi:Neuraminidase (sialidase)